MGIDIPEDQWKNILFLIHSSSICARHALIQCKVLHRAYFTNAKLAKIFPNRSDTCNRCKQSPADHIHMFWSCPKLMDYWSDIFRTLSQALNTTIAPNPLTVLFGLLPDSVASSTVHCVIAFTALLARHAILLKLKHASPPSHEDWLREVLQCIHLEKNQTLFQRIIEILLQNMEPYTGYYREHNCNIRAFSLES